MIKNLHSTTALTSPQICRDPITAAIAGALGVAEATLAYSLISIGVNLAVSLVTSWALAALAPSPEGAERGLLANGRDATAPREYVYGQIRKGGTISYLEATGDDNKYLHMIIVLAGHEVEEIGDIYINDEIVTVTTDDVLGDNYVTGDVWKSKIRIKKHLGDQVAADSDLLAESNQIDANFVGNGLAYLYVRLTYDTEVFASGIPLITAVVKGKKTYDPVTTNTNYSANFGRAVRDYLTASYGLAEPATAMDDVTLASATTVSDEAVTLDAGGTEKRYEVNGVIRADQPRGTVLRNMMTAGAGTLFWGQGKWQLRPGYYSSPVKTLTEDDFRSAVSVSTRTPRRDNFNSIIGTFNDAEQDYITAEYPKVASAAFLAEDNAIASTLDLALPYTTSAAAAQRLAKMTLFRGREQITLSAEFGFGAFDLEPGDIVALTLPRYGFTAKEFEVVGWRFAPNPEAGDLRISLTLRETSEAAFDWDAEETAITANNSSLPDWRETAAVTLQAPTVQIVGLPDGVEMPVLLANWTVTGEALAADYVFQWRDNAIDYAANGGFVTLSSPTTREQDIYDAYLSILNRVPDQDGFDGYESGGLTIAQIEADLAASSEATNQAEFKSIVTKTKRAELRSLAVGQYYDLRVVSRTSLGVISEESATTFLVTGDTTAPPTPTHDGKTNGVIGKQATIRWNNPATYGGGAPVYDLRHTEIWRNTSNTTTGATLLGVSPTEEYIDTSAAASTLYYYFLRAVDYTGNQSAFDAGRSVTTDAELTDGADGDDGDDGADGADAINIVVNPASVVLPASSFGVVSSYAGSGCKISVEEGNSALNFTTAGSVTNGQWRISGVGVYTNGSSSTDITPGARSDSGNDAQVANHSAMANGVDAVLITYFIQYRSNAGDYGTLSISQTVSKAKAGAAGGDGARGAGRWHIDVDGVNYVSGTDGRLPLTTGDAQEAWNEGSGDQPTTPVASDQAWFYKGTLAAPTSQSVWIYNGSSWTEQDEVIDGNLLVTGTGTFDKLVVNSGIFQDDGSGGLDIITDSINDYNAELKSAGGTITASGSWQNLDSWSFTVGDEGHLVVRVHCSLTFTKSGSDDPTTEYVEYLLRLESTVPGEGYQAIFAQSCCVIAAPNSGDVGTSVDHTLVFPPSAFSSRTAGTADFDLDVQITNRDSTSSYLFYGRPYIEVFEIKR